MREFRRIEVGGKPIPEGLVLCKWFASRFNSNKNILMAIVGGTGSGKSYATIRIEEKWYQYKFKKPFPVENICFSIKEAMDRIQTGNLKRGEIIVIEEAGVLMNSLEFQNRIQRFFGWVLQSFRCKNIGIIFNLPSLNMLNKTARILLHAIFLTESVNTKTQESILKCFYMDTNYITGEQQPRYFKHVHNKHLVRVKKMRFFIPSADILSAYEKKKSDFVDKTGTHLMQEIEREELEKELKRMTPLQRAAIKALKNNDLSSLTKFSIKDDKEQIELERNSLGEIVRKEKKQIGTISKPIRDETGKITGYEDLPLYEK